MIKFNNGTYHLMDPKSYRVVASFGLLKMAEKALKEASK